MLLNTPPEDMKKSEDGLFEKRDSADELIEKGKSLLSAMRKYIEENHVTIKKEDYNSYYYFYCGRISVSVSDMPCLEEQKEMEKLKGQFFSYISEMLAKKSSEEYHEILADLKRRMEHSERRMNDLEYCCSAVCSLVETTQKLATGNQLSELSDMKQRYFEGMQRVKNSWESEMNRWKSEMEAMKRSREEIEKVLELELQKAIVGFEQKRNEIMPNIMAFYNYCRENGCEFECRGVRLYPSHKGICIEKESRLSYVGFEYKYYCTLGADYSLKMSSGHGDKYGSQVTLEKCPYRRIKGILEDGTIIVETEGYARLEEWVFQKVPEKERLTIKSQDLN